MVAQPSSCPFPLDFNIISCVEFLDFQYWELRGCIPFCPRLLSKKAMAHPAWIDDVRFPSGISRAWPFWSCYMWPFVYLHVGCLYKLHSHFRWSIFLRIAWLISNVCQKKPGQCLFFLWRVPSYLFLLMESIPVPFSRFNSTKIRLSDHILVGKTPNLPW